MSLGAAREYVRVAHRLASLPRIDDAMRRGELSYTKVRAMVRVATADNEELLMHQARGSTGAQLERVCAAFHRLPEHARPTDDERRYARKRTHRDGTMTLELRLMPDEVNELWLALTETRTRLASEMEERPTLVDAALHWARSEALENAAPRIQPSKDVERAAGTSHVRAEPADEVDAALQSRSAPADSAESSNVNDLGHGLDGPGESVPSSETGVSPAGGAASPPTCSCGRGAAPSRAVLPLLYVHLRPEHIISGAPSSDGDPPEESRSLRGPTTLGESSQPEPWRAELHDGTPISGAALRRIACDCGLVAAQVDARGTPLDLGRRRRRVSVPLMRALLLRDRQCRFPGCKHRGFLQAHHVEHWCDGGTTDLDNLLLLCHAHHVAVHEGGFEVATKMDADGWYPEFRTPEGEVLHPAPVRPPIDGDGASLLRRRHQARPEPILRPVPLWDGTPLDLEAAVDALANKTPPRTT